jgi:hypothetical protein
VGFNLLVAVALFTIVICFYEFRAICADCSDSNHETVVLEENVEVNPNYHDEQNDGAVFLAKKAESSSAAAKKGKGTAKKTSSD